jgi:hypothetical protein
MYFQVRGIYTTSSWERKNTGCMLYIRCTLYIRCALSTGKYGKSLTCHTWHTNSCFVISHLWIFLTAGVTRQSNWPNLGHSSSNLSNICLVSVSAQKSLFFGNYASIFNSEKSQPHTQTPARTASYVTCPWLLIQNVHYSWLSPTSGGHLLHHNQWTHYTTVTGTNLCLWGRPFFFQ